MNSPTRFREPGCPLPQAVRLSPLGFGSLRTSQWRTGRGSCSRDRGRSRLGPAPGGGREAIPSAGAWRRDTPAQGPRRGAAIRVGGSFSSGRGGHLGAARGLILPERSPGGAGLLRGAQPGRRCGPCDPTGPGDTLDGGVAPTPCAVLQPRGGKPLRVSAFATPASVGWKSASKLQAPESTCPRGLGGGGYAQELERHRGPIQPAGRELVGASEPRRAPAAVGVQTPVCAVLDFSIPAGGP